MRKMDFLSMADTWVLLFWSTNNLLFYLVFRSFTFNAIICMIGLKPNIFLIVFCLFHLFLLSFLLLLLTAFELVGAFFIISLFISTITSFNLLKNFANCPRAYSLFFCNPMDWVRCQASLPLTIFQSLPKFMSTWINHTIQPSHLLPRLPFSICLLYLI